MKKYIKKIDRSALTPVISVLLSITIVFAAISSIVIWGLPYVESRTTEELQERAFSQLTNLNEAIYSMSYESPGKKSTTTINLKDSALYGEENSGRMVITNTIKDGYDYDIISGLDSPTSSTFTLQMNSGDVTRAEAYWLTDDMGTPCFLAGTKVLMADGSYKNIEDIKTGDKVVSFDEVNNRATVGIVSMFFEHPAFEMGEYYLLVNKVLRVTPGHLIYVENSGWTSADDIKIGDVLFGLENDCRVFSIEKVFDKETTYDFMVDGYHNFFVLVGSCNVLVHNAGGSQTSFPTSYGKIFNEWSNPEMAFSDDNKYAIGGSGEAEDYSSFGFSIPAGSTINGITVEVEGYKDSKTDPTLSIKLSWDGGKSWTAEKSNTSSDGLEVKQFGGESDTWGRTWASSDFDNGNFFVYCRVDGEKAVLQVDYIRVTVNYTTSGGNSPPSSPTGLLCEGEENPGHVVDHTPEFSAVYNDPDSDDIATQYHIQVGNGILPPGSMWDYIGNCNVNVGERCPDITYAGEPLTDGSSYEWCIRFYDGESWGNWSEIASFSMNSKPSASVVSPDIGATDVSTSPRLDWDFSDNDGDSQASYWLQVDDDSDFSSPVVNTGVVASSNTYHDVSGLSNGVKYYWRVNVLDGYEWSGWQGGSSWYFTTAAGNSPPYQPSTPNPSNEAVDVSINTDLSWSGGDPDEGDTVTYDLYFYAASNVSVFLMKKDLQGPTASNLTVASYDPGTLEYDTSYYWQVVATDSHGAVTNGSIWHFTTVAGGGGGDNPELDYSPTSYDFGAMLQNTQGTTSFKIWNNDNSGTSLTFSLSSNSWISITPSSGESRGPTDKVTITVTVNTSDLVAGRSYTGRVAISSNGGSGYFTVYVTVVDNYITVLKPHAGDEYRVGDTLTITWTNLSDAGNQVNITLWDSTNNAEITTIATDVNINDHAYTWSIPMNLIPSGTHSKRVFVNISNTTTGAYGWSSSFYILERFDGIYRNESLDVTSIPIPGYNRYELSTSKYYFNGTVVIELYDNSVIFGRIWVFDTDAIVYDINSNTGNYKVINEFDGTIFDYPSANAYVKSGPRIENTSNVFSIFVTQLKMSSYSGVSGDGNYKIRSTLGVSSQRERIKIYSLSIYMFGTYNQSWERYFTQNFGSISSSVSNLVYRYDGIRWLTLQHATVKFSIGL